MKTILVAATLAHAPADAAAAARLARVFAARVVLLHVHQAVPDRAWDEAKRLAARQSPNADITFRARFGEPAAEIARAVISERADLLVLRAGRRWHAPEGFSGDRTFFRFTLHSVVARVLDHAGCPVLVLPPDCDDIAPRRIVCALNLDGRDAGVLALAGQVARAAACELHLVHATADMQIHKPGGSRVAAAWERSLGETARARIDQMKQAAAPGARVAIASGDLVRLTRRLADGEGAMVAVAHWLRRYHWERDSRAFALIRNATVPVLVRTDPAAADEAAPAAAANNPQARPKFSGSWWAAALVAAFLLGAGLTATAIFEWLPPARLCALFARGCGDVMKAGLAPITHAAGDP